MRKYFLKKETVLQKDTEMGKYRHVRRKKID